MQKKRDKRRRIIPNRIFAKLWMGAESTESEREFIRKYSSSISTERIDFKSLGIEYEEAVHLLKEIHEKQHMSVKEILENVGQKKSEVSKTFCIPIRTIEDWCSGKNKCSSYIRLQFIRYYHLLNLGKYIYVEYDEVYKASKPTVYNKKAKK